MITEAWPQFSFPFTHVHPSTRTHTHQQWTELPHQFCWTSSESPYKEQWTVWQSTGTSGSDVKPNTNCPFAISDVHKCIHVQFTKTATNTCVLTNVLCAFWHQGAAEVRKVPSRPLLTLQLSKMSGSYSAHNLSALSAPLGAPHSYLKWIWQNKQSESSAYKHAEQRSVWTRSSSGASQWK